MEESFLGERGMSDLFTAFTNLQPVKSVDTGVEVFEDPEISKIQSLKPVSKAQTPKTPPTPKIKQAEIPTLFTDVGEVTDIRLSRVEPQPFDVRKEIPLPTKEKVGVEKAKIADVSGVEAPTGVSIAPGSLEFEGFEAKPSWLESALGFLVGPSAGGLAGSIQRKRQIANQNIFRQGMLDIHELLRSSDPEDVTLGREALVSIDLRQFPGISPQSIKEYMDTAIALQGDDNITESLRYFQDIISQNPEGGESFLSAMQTVARTPDGIGHINRIFQNPNATKALQNLYPSQLNALEAERLQNLKSGISNSDTVANRFYLNWAKDFALNNPEYDLTKDTIVRSILSGTPVPAKIITKSIGDLTDKFTPSKMDEAKLKNVQFRNKALSEKEGRTPESNATDIKTLFEASGLPNPMPSNVKAIPDHLFQQFQKTFDILSKQKLKRDQANEIIKEFGATDAGLSDERRAQRAAALISIGVPSDLSNSEAAFDRARKLQSSIADLNRLSISHASLMNRRFYVAASIRRQQINAVDLRTILNNMRKEGVRRNDPNFNIALNRLNAILVSSPFNLTPIKPVARNGIPIKDPASRTKVKGFFGSSVEQILRHEPILPQRPGEDPGNLSEYFGRVLNLYNKLEADATKAQTVEEVSDNRGLDLFKAQSQADQQKITDFVRGMINNGKTHNEFIATLRANDTPEDSIEAYSVLYKLLSAQAGQELTKPGSLIVPNQ